MDTLVGVDWRLEGGSEEVRVWMTDQLKRHYDMIVQSAWNAKLYGYNVMERIWAKVDGQYIVDRISEKPFEWFVPKRDGTLLYRKNSSIIVNDDLLAVQGVIVDTNFKFLLTQNKPTWKNPRGKALLAYLFWPWFYRKATWQFWMQFLERNGQPLLLGEGADPAQIAQQLAMAVQDAVIAVPTGTKVSTVAPSNRGEAFNLAEDRLVRRIQKILLGQTLTSDVAIKGSGAKALGDVHNEVRLDKTIGDLKVVGPTIQNYLDALRFLNFPSSRPVNLVYAIDRGLETGRATRDATLINTGNIEFTDQYYTREYGFKKGDFKIISPSKIKQSPQGQAKTNEDNKDPGSSTQESQTPKEDADE
jgi:phage gp29-like protein